MQLDVNLWFVRWFFWSRRVVDRFTNRYGWVPRPTTNLCEFMRTIVLGSLIAAVVLACYLYALFVVFVLPFLVFHVSVIGIGLGIIVAILMVLTLCIAVIIGLRVGIARVVIYYREKPRSTFFGLLIHYLVAIKQHYCPVIIFQDKHDG